MRISSLKLYGFFLGVFAFTSIGKAQVNVDSLMNVWHNEQHTPLERLDAIDAVMAHKIKTEGQASFEQVLTLAKAQYHFSQKHAIQKISANSAEVIAQIYTYLPQTDSTIKYYKLCIEAHDFMQSGKKAFEKRLALTEIYFNSEKFSLIPPLLEPSLVSPHQSITPIEIALANFYIGFAFMTKNNHAEAIKKFEQTRNGFEIDNVPFFGFAINGFLGHSYAHIGQFSKSDSLFKRAFTFAPQIEDVNAKCEVYQYRARAYLLQGKYLAAEKLLQELIKIPELELSALASLFQDLGELSYDSDQYKKAINYDKQSYDIYKQIGDELGMAAELNNMARTYSSMGNHGKALELNQKSLKIAISKGDSTSISTSYNNVGSTYWDLGDNSQAISFTQKALKIAKKAGDVRQEAMCLYNLSLIYESINIDSVIHYKLACQKIYEDLSYYPGLADINNDFGNLYHFDDAKGIEYHLKSLEINRKINRPAAIAGNLINLGHCYLSSDLERSISYYHEGGSIAKKLGMKTYYKNSVSSLMYLYFRNDQMDSARYYSNINLDLINYDIENNFPSLTESEKLKYLKTFQEDLLGLNHFFIEDYLNNPSYNTHIFELAIKHKGLLLKSALRLKQVIMNSDNVEQKKLYKSWINSRQLCKDQSLTQEERIRFSAQCDSLERLLSKSTKHNLSSGSDNNFKKVQAQLSKNQVAIEFIRYQEKHDTSETIYYAALIVMKGEKRPILTRMCAEKDIQRLIYNEKGNNQNTINTLYTNSALHQLIWSSIDSVLNAKKINSIYYAPIGVISRISMGALVSPEGHYLFDEYELIQLSSTAEILNRKNQVPINDPSLIAFGGIKYSQENSICEENWSYLPGTLEEVKNISHYWEKKPNKLTVLKGFNASESAFKHQAKDNSIVHIASHGFFYKHPDDVKASIARESSVIDHEIEFRSGNISQKQLSHSQDPMDRSGLIFSGANEHCDSISYDKDDGILTANELSNLNLENVKLVVLSACETGLGDIVDNEGVYGLQRACKIAGVDNIIMSLWKVPDKETMEFMTLFYQELQLTKSISQSFRTVQANMSQKYPPYFWAAFTLIE